MADFTALGGGLETRCDPSATSSTSGVEALQGAGFALVGVNNSLAFICRINGQPPATMDGESCHTTPPASAYWSYWQAPNGGSWSYSQTGASTSRVTVGGFEGWAFYKGGGTASPPGAKATRPPPPVKPTFHMGPAASTKAAPKPSSSTTSSASKTATPTGTSTGPGLVLATPDGTSTSSSVQAGGALPGGDPSPGPSPWPFVIGLAAIGLISGGAGLVVYQRRRAGGI